VVVPLGSVGVDGPGDDGLALLPAGQGPEQVGEAVEVGHHLRAVDDRRQGAALGPAAHCAGHVQAGGHLVPTGGDELGGRIEAFAGLVDEVLESLHHLGPHPTSGGLELVEFLVVAGQFGHDDPEVAFEAEQDPAQFVVAGGPCKADGGLRLNTPLAPALRLGADRVLVVALRQETRNASEAELTRTHGAAYGSPLFLFGKVLNALMLDHLDTDLSRMHVVNEILEHGETAYGAGFTDKLNQVALRKSARPFRHIHDLVIRPTADPGLLAGQILSNLSDAHSRSPLIRLAARGLEDGDRSPESDLLSYLLFDSDFVAPLADLGYRDAAAREEELVAFFTD